MIKMNNIERLKKLKKYKENSILKPYLIHIEFEVENVLSLLENDKELRELYQNNHYNIYSLVNDTKQFIHRIQNLIKIL